jgi:hypothetical protein
MKKKPSYNQDVLKIIRKKHGFSYDYIRKSIRGIRISESSKLIRTEYESICKKIKKALEDQ